MTKLCNIKEDNSVEENNASFPRTVAKRVQVVDNMFTCPWFFGSHATNPHLGRFGREL